LTAWTLACEGFDPGDERLREALCTLGNGYFATRGAAPEATADDVHYPGTYVAGCYNRLVSQVAGRDVENEDLVNVPNWLPLTFRPEGGDWLDLRQVELLDSRQELDLRHGVLTRFLSFLDPQGRVTRVTQRRFVHMADHHVAGLETTIVPENWSGRLEVRSALDGRVTNSGVARYRLLDGRHLAPLETGDAGDDAIWLLVETRSSHVRIAQAARTRVLRDGEPVAAERRTVQEPGFVAHDLAVDVREGEPLTVEKVVTLFTSRARAVAEPGHAARTWVARVGGFEELLERHVAAWGGLWRRCRIGIDADDHDVASTVNLHVFHLLQTVSGHTIDLDVGVPARGLHGEAYRGHIFWDELFVFPFLNLRFPEATRALLRYRHRRLPEARWAARQAGYQGAMYPWQSGSDGREETQRLHLNPRSGRWLPDNSHLQRHVNVAIELRALLERLGYRLEPAAIPRNVDYYLQRTSHGSTLSGVVHAWVLARSDRSRSWNFFAEALASDVHDVQGGTTAEGIHLGAMAGTVDLAQRCYTGLETREGVLWLSPRLPEGLDGIDFAVRYRGHWGIHLHVTPQVLRVLVAGSDATPLKVGFKGEVVQIEPGGMREFPL